MGRQLKKKFPIKVSLKAKIIEVGGDGTANKLYCFARIFEFLILKQE